MHLVLFVVQQNFLHSQMKPLLKLLTIAFVIYAKSGFAQESPPNIVLLFCDDLGYGDVQVLNPERGKIPTPHIDKLASQGMIFTDAHSGSSVCTPTRYGLLTGRYSWRTTLQSGVVQGFAPNLISEGRTTVADLLKEKGYHTAIIGKWHLNFQYADPDTGEFLKRGPKGTLAPVGSKIPDGPLERGFDYFHGPHHARDMKAVIEDDTVIAHDDPINMLPRLRQKAVEYVNARGKSKTGEPFFLYVPFGSPHTPILPTKEWQGKSGLGAYADFVMQTDEACGAILDALEQNGFTENTLVIFSSDNGCSKAANIPAFSDSNIWNPTSFGNFARAVVAKQYDSQWPYSEVHESAIEQLVQWTALSDSKVPAGIASPPVSYFDDRGVVVSRGQQKDPFSIALKAGDNDENHNHSDVGSYSIVLGKVLMAGDIGKPIYKAGAFGSQNKSRNSWGHPVPRVDDQLQSDGAAHFGKVLNTDFSANSDWVEIDLSAAYVVDSLETLVRTYENQKSGNGTITIVDNFEASKPIPFGTAIMSYADFKQTGPNTILLTNNGKSVEVEISSKGGEVRILREIVPVDLQSYLTAFRIGIDFVEPTSSGSISMSFTPVDTIVEETPEEYTERMQWWSDSKFGMFIHWGAYSQAGGEWKGDPNHGEWLQFSAKIPLAEYQELARSFNPVEFDADEWVRIAKNAGMKYMVITAKHHDGFALFKSRATPYNIVDWSIYGKDAIEQLADACHRGGLKFGVYYSLGRDWHHPDVPTGGKKGRPAGDRSNLIDFPDETVKDFKTYYQRKVLPQLRELLTQNGTIDIVWFDTPEKTSKAQSHELVQMIHSLHPDCIVNSRVGNGLGDFGTPEQKIPSGPNAKPWETCMTVSTRFWGYNKSIGFRESSDLVRNLIDIASKGGNYLLNVGPTGEGIIPQASVDRLSAMGDWLKINGEAIYGSGPTPFGAEVGSYSETEKDKNGKRKFISKWEWRATTAPGKLFVHLFEWSQNLELPSIPESIQKVYLLADTEKTELTFTQSENGISITLPETAPDAVASVLCFELKE